MLIGIIKNETAKINYYIHLDKQENYNELSVIETTKNKTKALNKEEAINLLKTILSSKLTYKEKYNDYDVYLDEANNTRYFKNGQEDYIMFLENNGVSAIKCFDNKNKIGLNAKAYKIVASTIGFSIILSTIALIPIADDTRYTEGIKYAFSNAVPLTSTEAVNLINTSFYLTNEEKEHFANKDYFDFVLSHTESKDREYYLRNSLTNMRIKHYNQDFFPSAVGYYNPLDINAINICNDVDPTTPEYRDVESHEFIHLTQDQNEYLYIMEATAEILEYEFYNQPCDGYPELVKRAKVLMEIIGPEPITSCIYSGDTTHFEDSIKQYLSEEDANKLLELFKTSTTSLYEANNTMTSVNKEIDSLLAKMYQNKTGKDIKEDIMMRIIYAYNPTERIYFNSSLKNYNKDYFLNTSVEQIDELDLDYVVNSGLVKNYTYNKPTQIEHDGKTGIYIESHTVQDFSEVELTDQYYLYIEFKDGTKGTCNYNINTDTWDKVTHYKILKIYEPSIHKKFPDQVINSINYKEFPKKEEIQGKTI